MKKISYLFYCFLSLLLSLPLKVRAQTNIGDDFDIPKPMGSTTIQDIVAKLIDTAFAVAGVVAVIYMIIGGYQYIVSSGNPEQAAQGKSTMLYAVLGLLAVFISFLFIRYLMLKMGVSEQFIPGLGGP